MFDQKTGALMLILILTVGVLVTATGCQPASEEGGKSDEVRLSSGGASFPYPLYSKWIDVYTDKNDVKIDYQSIGSGGGIKGIMDGTFDFAGSDAPMKDEELAKAESEIMHIPTVMGAVVTSYNLPEVEEQIKLTGDILADIYLGKITKWNDEEIKKANPNLELPGQDIVPIRRSDGSGTTNAFTDYLNKVSGDWEEEVGYGKSVSWPNVGIGAKGNEGVTGQILDIEGAIGYVELAYAEENNLQYTSLKNKSGNYVEPSLDTVTAAAAGAVENMPEDMRVSITNSPGEEAWPISTFTYLLVNKEYEDQAKTGEMIDYIWWALSEGDSYAKELLYAPLPDNLLNKVKAKLEAIKVDGEAVRPALEN
ncbi:MAG: phosphate ABC transporter substrate-binding protein PstS [Bacillota bacterium]